MRFLLLLCFITPFHFSCNHARISDIHSVVVGDGHPIIIIHGGPGLSHDYLLEHLEPLSKKYKLIFYDQRGCGQSFEAGDTGTMNVNQFVEDIENLRTQYNLDKITLMAHSWGGILALNYALTYPNHLDALIMVDAIGASTSINAKANTALAQKLTAADNQRRLEIMQSEAFKNRDVSSVEELMMIGFKHQFHDKSKLELLNLQLDDHFFETSELLQGMSVELAQYDLLDEITEISAPTLLIYGDHDPLTGLAGDQLYETIPDAQLSIIAQAGHFPFIEQPMLFIQEVDQFINKYVGD